MQGEERRAQEQHPGTSPALANASLGILAQVERLDVLWEGSRTWGRRDSNDGTMALRVAGHFVILQRRELTAVTHFCLEESKALEITTRGHNAAVCHYQET